MNQNLTPTGEALRALGGESSFFSSGGVINHVYGMPPLTKIEQHVHTYDHMSVLVAGKVTLVSGKVATELTAPAIVELKAYVKHTVINHDQPSIWMCINNEDRLMAEDNAKPVASDLESKALYSPLP